MFSGDENYGRYLDLNEAFELYVNLEHVPKVNSLKFLNVLDNFHEIPLKAKKYPNYEKYLRIFMEYLENFFKRQNPLFDYELLKKNTVEQFEIDWNNKNVKGWFSDDQDDKSVFCTACSKIIANQNVYEYHIEGSAHKRAEKASENRFKKPKLDKAMSFKDLARIEAILRAYLDKLSIIREETSLHAERKQTLTTDELMADALEEAEINESEEEDEKLYNPLKLPLGWDGKPIPYWLYKLHGLGVEYPCEICGNYVYMGRKAFDRHFQVTSRCNSLLLSLNRSGIPGMAPRPWNEMSRHPEYQAFSGNHPHRGCLYP